ncbi:MAG: hypothetical protein ACOYON_04750 [Fimbriimonas sp.]
MKSREPNKREPMTPLDYSVMFGGPILFFVIAWFGVTQLLGPAPRVNPVEKLRREAVKPGMTESQVIAEVGQPKSIETSPSGGYSFRYQRGVWNPDRKTFVEEDAYVDFTSGGTVLAVNFDSREPRLPGDPAPTSR